jgi:hypothetical protein
MAKFNTLAKATQPKYGIIRIPAAFDLGQNATVAAVIAASRTKISTNATPGMWKPKNSHDQAAFNTNWTANSDSGPRACLNPPCRQTNHAATDMKMYNTVQTGPNSQLGGFQDGLTSVAYHDGMLGAVATEPRAAAEKQMVKIATSPMVCLIGDILRLFARR